MRLLLLAPTLSSAVALFVPGLLEGATLHVPADYSTIGAGLAAAAQGDTVEVACGQYFEGDLSVHSALVLRSTTGDPNCVTINAGGLHSSCILVQQVGSSTTLEGIEFVGGTGSGGGIYCSNGGSPLLRNCRFRDNHTGGDGGGLVLASGSAPRVLNCEFVDNDAFQDGSNNLRRGGAIWSNHSAPVFEECLIRRNRARLGGGAFAMNSELTFTRCRFERNEGHVGGGVFASNCEMTFVECALEENTTPLLVGAQGVGGGVFGEGSSWSFTDCRFVGNVAGTRGGAARCAGPGHVLMSGCVVAENSAYLSAGGVDLSLSMGGDFLNCLFLRNSVTTGRVGALVVSAPSSVVGCTFFGNHSPLDGSAIVWASPILTLARTIIAGGRGGAAVHTLSKDVTSITCCDIFGNEGGDWVGGVADQLGQNGNISLDPGFCNAADDDFTLNVASPCAPGKSPEGCELIGALPTACGAVSVTARSWAELKASFR